MRSLIITFVRHAEEIRPFKTRESILAIRVSQISVHDTSNHLGSACSVIADHLGVSPRAVCVCATTAAECGIDFSALRQKFGPNQCERVCEGNITQRRRTQRKSGKKGDAKAKQQNNK